MQEIVKAATLISLSGAFLDAGAVQAATEVAQLADGRGGIIAGLALPVLGWVG